MRHRVSLLRPNVHCPAASRAFWNSSLRNWPIATATHWTHYAAVARIGRSVGSVAPMARYPPVGHPRPSIDHRSPRHMQSRARFMAAKGTHGADIIRMVTPNGFQDFPILQVQRHQPQPRGAGGAGVFPKVGESHGERMKGPEESATSVVQTEDRRSKDRGFGRTWHDPSGDMRRIQDIVVLYVGLRRIGGEGCGLECAADLRAGCRGASASTRRGPRRPMPGALQPTEDGAARSSHTRCCLAVQWRVCRPGALVNQRPKAASCPCG